MSRFMRFLSFLLPVIASAAFVPTAFSQGNISPPSDALDSNGNPVSFMKSLNQIEPRTLIPSIPFDIRMPGSYYLSPASSNSLNAAAAVGTNAISIWSSNVRLDLNGFVLMGTNTAMNGVFVNGGGGPSNTCVNVVIRNGIIAGWAGYGISAGGSPEITITDVKVVMNGQGGILAGDNAHIERCSVYQNGFGNFQGGIGDGINAGQYSTISDCKSRGNYGANIHGQQHCRIIGCTAIGSANADGIHCEDYSTVRDCEAGCNMYAGIYVANLCRIKDNNCGQNGTNGSAPQSAGIFVNGINNIIEGNLVSGNGKGISMSGAGNMLIHNAASRNGYPVSNPTNDYVTPPAMTNFMGAQVSFGGGASGGQNFSNTNPWANFSFTTP